MMSLIWGIIVLIALCNALIWATKKINNQSIRIATRSISLLLICIIWLYAYWDQVHALFR